MKSQLEAREGKGLSLDISYNELMKVVSETTRTVSQVTPGVEVENVTAQLENGQVVEYMDLVDEKQPS